MTVGGEERSAATHFQPEIRMNGEGRGRRLDWGRSEGSGRGRGGRGQDGGLSPYFNSCLIRVLAAKHLPSSSPTPIHITPVLLHP